MKELGETLMKSEDRKKYDLTLVFTLKCTARCDICCTNSSIDRDEKMSLEDAKSYIDQANKISEIKSIDVSGGEPFIFFDLLKDIIAYAKGYGFETSCITNCFWAESRKIALKKLKKLVDSGLDRLGISADEFHQKHVPHERVKNCLYAARELKLPIVLLRVYTKNSKGLKELFSEYNVEEADYFDEIGSLSKSELPELIGDEIKVLEHPVIPLGRALSIPKSELPMRPYKDFLRFRCSALLEKQVIYPNGDVYGCCAVAGFLNPFYLGNAREKKLSDLLAKAKTNPFFEFIKVQGPAEMVKILREKNIFIPAEYTDQCHICKELCDEKNREFVEEILREKYFETLLLKTLIVDKDKNDKNKK